MFTAILYGAAGTGLILSFFQRQKENKNGAEKSMEVL